MEPHGNLILAQLDPADSARLHNRGSIRSFEARTLLQRQLEVVDHVYLPLSGIISLVQSLRDGGSVEALTVGREGIVGSQLALGVQVTASDAIYQVPGDALVLSADTFREELELTSELRPAVLRYVHAKETFLAQSVACNRLHRVDDRLARWLLHSLDRVEGETFHITHEFLGQMLGVRRASVTEAVGGLTAAGLVDHGRGRMRILDRSGLLRLACECYETVNAHFKTAMGGGWSRDGAASEDLRPRERIAEPSPS